MMGSRDTTPGFVTNFLQETQIREDHCEVGDLDIELEHWGEGGIPNPTPFHCFGGFPPITRLNPMSKLITWDPDYGKALWRCNLIPTPCCIVSSGSGGCSIPPQFLLAVCQTESQDPKSQTQAPGRISINLPVSSGPQNLKCTFLSILCSSCHHLRTHHLKYHRLQKETWAWLLPP